MHGSKNVNRCIISATKSVVKDVKNNCVKFWKKRLVDWFVKYFLFLSVSEANLTCPFFTERVDVSKVSGFLIIKPTSCTNFSNLFLE